MWWKQLHLLCWKTYLLKRRKYIGTLFEILLPTVICLILYASKTLSERIYYTEQHYTERNTAFADYATTDQPNPPLTIGMGLSYGDFPREYKGAHAVFLSNIMRQNNSKVAFINGGADPSDLEGFLKNYFSLLDQNPTELFMPTHFTSEEAFKSYITDSNYDNNDKVQIAFTTASYAPNYEIYVWMNDTRVGGIKNDIFTMTSATQPVNDLGNGFNSKYAQSYFDGSDMRSFDDVTRVTGGALDYQQILMKYVLFKNGHAPDPFTAPLDSTTAYWKQWKDSLYSWFYTSVNYDQSSREQLYLDQIEKASHILAAVVASPPDIKNTYPEPFKSATDPLDIINESFSKVSQVTRLIAEGLAAPIQNYIPIKFKESSFPTLSYTSDTFLTSAGDFLGTVFIFAFFYPVSVLIKHIMTERENRLTEGMQIFGVKQSVIVTSWYVLYGFIWLILSIIVAAASTLLWTGTNMFVIFVLFFVFCLACISYGYFMQSFFSSPKVAAIFSGICLILLQLPSNMAGKDLSHSSSTKTAICLAVSSCLSEGLYVINSFQNADNPLKNVSDMGNYYGGSSLAQVVGMLIVDIFLYLILGLYFEKVVPHTYGVPEKWNFIFRKAVWKEWIDSLSMKIRNKKVFDVGLPMYNADNREPREGGDNEFMEPFDGKDVKELLDVRNMSKTFHIGSESVHAVNKMNLTAYENEIFCLLGHNGAGKTTTISMLTGLLGISSGDAYINGISCKNKMEEIRKSIGVCPQYDVLFDYLTVEEHLRFFCTIKEITDIEDQINKSLDFVFLHKERYQMVDSLSGGQKRRLSIAIALLGDNKVIFLDEPSTGVDPFMRHQLWDKIKEQKKGRLIILTTHFMEEADYLGDRIAIMKEGKVQCCGRSLFLKKKYGVGNSLLVNKIDNTHNTDILVKKYIQSMIPTSKLSFTIANELCYTIPIGSAGVSTLLEELDDEEKKKLRLIRSYSLSVTTLEEVFLLVGTNTEFNQYRKQIMQKEEREQKQVDEGDVSPDASPVTQAGQDELRKSILDCHDFRVDSKEEIGLDVSIDEIQARKFSGLTLDQVPGRPEAPVLSHRTSQAEATSIRNNMEAEEIRKYQNRPLFWTHVRALIIKRFHIAKRDRRGMLFQIILPILFIILSLTVLSTDFSNKIVVSLTHNSYNNVQNVYYSAGPNLVSSNTCFTQSPTLFQSNNPKLQFSHADTLGSAPITTPLETSRFLLNKLKSEQATPEADPNTLTGYGSYFVNDCNRASGDLDVTLFYNTKSRDSLPIYLMELFNSMLAALSNSASSLLLKIKALPVVNSSRDLSDIFTCIFLSIGFAYIPAFCGLSLVRERTLKVKHIQLISGVSIPSYWISNLIFDFLYFLIPAIVTIIILLGFNVQTLVGSQTIGGTILIMVLYCFSVCSLTYCLQYFFESYIVAQNVLILTYILSGSFLLLFSFILSVLPDTRDVHNNVLVYIFYIFPSFAFIKGMMNMILINQSLFWKDGLKPSSIFVWDVLGFPILYMCISFVVFFSLAVAVDYLISTPILYDRFINFRTKNKLEELEKTKYKDLKISEDEDVLEEARRIAENDASNAHTEPIVIKNLKKLYVKNGVEKYAVKNISFGVQSNQCFGFLGVNGAGKSTTLKILTADEILTQGKILLGGYDIVSHSRNIRHLLGYCPQFDALAPELSANETLCLFARIKGFPESKIQAHIDEMIERLSLKEYQHRPCGYYSGGNRRKLSLGLALIGNPIIVLLDEPTSGIDSGSKKFIWSFINNTMKNRSVILTTHSMNECEALCGKVTIMVNGRLACLGSISEIKKKYGDNYQVECVFPPAADKSILQEKIQYVVDHMTKEFEEVRIQEQQGERVVFQIKRENNKLSSVYKYVEKLNLDNFIVDYSVSETSLEQIFIQFASKGQQDVVQRQGS